MGVYRPTTGRNGGGRTTVTPAEWLTRILPELDVVRGPDKRGEYVAWCPFHADGQGQPPHEPNLHVSERGYICFACPAKGGLKKLASAFNIDGNGGTRSDRRRSISHWYGSRVEAGNLPFVVARTDPGKPHQPPSAGTSGRSIE